MHDRNPMTPLAEHKFKEGKDGLRVITNAPEALRLRSVRPRRDRGRSRGGFKRGEAFGDIFGEKSSATFIGAASADDSQYFAARICR